MIHGLRDLRVVDFSSGIAGGYATKLLADAGAEVIAIEPPEGDPLRRWSSSGADLGGEDGALFRFLYASKRSFVIAPGGADDPALRELVAGADLVVESGAPGGPDPAALIRDVPGLVVLSITPYGRSGPWAQRPATEFVLQAESGSIGGRGLPRGEPFMAGARITEWVGGTYAAVGALAAVWRARRSGFGEHVDFSLLEVIHLASNVYLDLMHSLAGRPPLAAPARSVEIPSIEPTADGWVGFNTNTRQQFTDFLVLIERTDLLADEGLANLHQRTARMDEWNAIVRAWTTRHTTAEIVERAALLRIPVAPVNDGRRVLEHEQFRARGVFEKNPRGGFLQPRPPYRFRSAGDGAGNFIRPLEPAPRLGEHDGRIEPRALARPGGGRPPGPDAPLPLAGIRVLDATAWWAGPSSTHMLAALGAEVIHLESPKRPDGVRMASGAFIDRAEGFWEWSGMFVAANWNKKGLALDLADPEGLALAVRLIQACDVVVENFSPRVFEGFGLDGAAVGELAPDTIYVRMPAFGLDGPWRDHVGFAQTMEQITGLAWVTGHRDDQPRIPRGPCDPLAGMHAAFAVLVGLFERETSGRGHWVECSMVEGALNAAAEQALEYGAYGAILERDGNRCASAAPQGLYPCRGREQWLALSVETDDQWRALLAFLGDAPGAAALAGDPALATRAGRRARHDEIDATLRAWAAARELEETVEALVARGVPAGRVVDPRIATLHPQMQARGFVEEVTHPVVGTHGIPGLPFRYASVPQWLRVPSPTMGQHNREILSGILGLSDAELDALEARGVIGTRPPNA